MRARPVPIYESKKWIHEQLGHVLENYQGAGPQAEAYQRIVPAVADVENVKEAASTEIPRAAVQPAEEVYWNGCLQTESTGVELEMSKIRIPTQTKKYIQNSNSIAGQLAALDWAINGVAFDGN